MRRVSCTSWTNPAYGWPLNLATPLTASQYTTITGAWIDIGTLNDDQVECEFTPNGRDHYNQEHCSLLAAGNVSPVTFRSWRIKTRSPPTPTVTPFRITSKPSSPLHGPSYEPFTQNGCISRSTKPRSLFHTIPHRRLRRRRRAFVNGESMRSTCGMVRAILPSYAR
jgi:hypothetical protein